MALSEIRNQHPEVAERSEDTQGFVFNHTMLRVKDIQKSLEFYSKVLGFELIDQRDFPEAEFSLYFLGLLDKNTQIPEDDNERRLWMAGQPSVLELTHNHGTEKEEGPIYHNGNSQPQGFGHICLSVPDIEAACEHFERLNVDFQKRLTDGRMKDIAFIKDPDGYWIEIISNTVAPH